MITFEEWLNYLDDKIQEARQRRCLTMFPMKALEEKELPENKIE